MELLRDCLDRGLDPNAEAPDDKLTLLHHAIDVESDSHAQSGDPLTATATAYLLARGADPLRATTADGSRTVSALHYATVSGHWLAQELIERMGGEGNSSRE
jgi:hypothetical protein